VDLLKENFVYLFQSWFSCEKNFLQMGLSIENIDHYPGGGWPPYPVLGYQMVIICAMCTARFASVSSLARGRNTDSPSQTPIPVYIT